MYLSGSAPPATCLAGQDRAPPVEAGEWLRYAAAVEGMRDAIDKRIRAVIPGDEGAIASALITGKRGAVTPAVKDAFYVSSLAHVLAIAGFHMAVMTGLVFFFVRGGLALIPSLARHRPIKKWAAAAAFAAATFYLVLSGAGIATQRAFIMVAVVLVGVMVDRPALTFRTLSFAGLAILTLAPQALLTPSFQLSFAATLALIAAYQYGLPWHAKADTAFGARMALWGGREFAAIAFTSLIAGLATTPYAAYNFYRLAPYGVLANLLAMPVVSAWIMPMGILGVLTLPLGFDGVFWRLMGEGIEWIIAVVLWVANLPGAVGRMHAFGVGPLLLNSVGLLLLCLLRSPLRLLGALPAVAALVWAVATPQPDLLVSPDGQTAALRGADGRLAVLHVGRDDFAVEDWLAADADGRDVHDRGLTQGIACDPSGCIGKLASGGLVAYAVEPECVRGRLRPRGPDPRGARRSAARLRRPGDWTAHMVRPRRAGAALERLGFCHGVRRGRRISIGHGRRHRRNGKKPASRVRTVRPRAMRRRGRTISRRISSAGTARRACPESARGWAAGCALRKRYWPARARSRRRGGGSVSASLPRRRSSATTMSPVSAASVRLSSAMSPSRMPASIIESPRTSSAKCSPVVRRSGGMLMVWLRVWMASIGVPAAIRPITGTATGRPPSSSEDVRTRPRLPSMTLGVNPRERPELMPWAIDSGSLITSMARARFGSRRMKPRSSSAVIRRWMPDFERRSSASFISSKDGGTPASFSRSWINRNSSACLRVSIGGSSSLPRLAREFRSGRPAAETNHERTLSVPYVFRNHLI